MRKRISFKNNTLLKIMCAFTIVIIFVTIVFSANIYQSGKNSTHERYMRENLQKFQVVDKEIYKNVNEINMILKMMNNNPEFLRYVENKNCNNAEFSNIVTEYIKNVDFIKNVAVITDDCFFSLNPEDDSTTALQMKMLYNSIDIRPGKLSWFGRNKTELITGDNIIVAASNLSEYGFNKNKKMVYFFLDAPSFFNVFGDFINENEFFAVIDESGNLIYTTNYTKWYELFLLNFENSAKINESSNVFFNYKDDLISSFASSANSLKYIRISTEENYNKGLKAIIYSTTLLGLLLFIIVFFVFYLYVRNSIRVDTKDMIDNIKEKEEERRIAELKAVTYQINPHFLYNTLTAIKMVALMEKNYSIAESLTLLNKVLKDTLSKAGKLISVCEEVENIKNYVHLMNIRYEGKINIEYDIDEDSINKHIISFITQPIIENAIQHGISKKLKNPDYNSQIIFSTRYENDVLYVEVFDNGMGMSKEKTDGLFIKKDESKSYKSIGLRNIYQRLKSSYGDNCGIKVESEEGLYTKITLYFSEENNSN